MSKRLFLLDGMALVYRAHFAFINRPIVTSSGVNTSALFGFTNTLLEILKNRQPTHLAVAFDTEAPTARHEAFEAYKAQREEMPEELAEAIPNVKRLCRAFHIPVLELDGFEADDLIGTLVRRAEKEGFESYMVTPDKDFAQLVDESTFMLKPGKQGSDAELIRKPDVLNKWGVERPEQVIDILGLWGDASDNIPGIPGVGEKTAIKLIQQFGSVEELLKNTDQLKGKQKEKVESHRDQAVLSKQLATIDCNAPLEVGLDDLILKDPDEEELKKLFVEFEFNSIGKRMFGEEFKAGRGFEPKAESGSNERPGKQATDEAPASASLKTLKDVEHDYETVRTAGERRKLIARLKKLKSFCFDTETTSLDQHATVLIGLSFAWKPGHAVYVQLTNKELHEDGLFARDDADSMRKEVLESLGDFREVFADASIEKIGHNLKFDLSVLRWHGIEVRGELFDTMIAHSLVEPEQRHGMDFLAEAYLGYSPISIKQLIGENKKAQINMSRVPLDQLAEYAAEDADVTRQLHDILKPLLKQGGQEEVFFKIEAPLLPVLVDMECEGIRVDAEVLGAFSKQLEQRMGELEKRVHELAGEPFNLNSPKQLGELLFDTMKLVEKPKKTPSGQYATDEQTLQSLSSEHEIVRLLLEFRAMTKLKSTYADALPQSIKEHTGRVHTTFHQTATATGRLASQHPNLQNIPIRTELGQEIRRAFVPRDQDYLLLSADYSQIELRIIAALSQDAGMLEAFNSGEDIHTATAARVFGVDLKKVDSEQRRKAKMVNFGIAYGISAFGLGQRLGISRTEAAEIIEHYFKSYPGIRNYIDSTIEFARDKGYVETVTGRRRRIRDINSANNTVRSAAERLAINMPIQGTAADMIKLAMSAVHQELVKKEWRTKLLLQVHDELVFDVYRKEEKEVRSMVEEKMKNALKLDAPIEVEIGSGNNWLEAH